MTSDSFPESPVPSDAHLWPGETPFTDFGQFGVGKIDLRVFDQGRWWVDNEGQPHVIAEMSFDYASNVLTHLRAHAEGFHSRSILRWNLQALGGAELEPWADHERVFATSGTLQVITASDWLETALLVIALRSRLGENRQPRA